MDRDLHSGHRERLRRRAQEEGLDGFNPHQVLELLLFYAIPRQDTSAIAHRLIDRFGSVAQVLSQPADELRKVSGVGQRAARWLTSLGTLTEAYGALTQADRVVIRNHADAARFCAGLEGEILRPQAWQICMTPVGVVQACSKIADSAAWAEAECLRLSLDEILSVHARNVILAVFPDEARPEAEAYDCDGAREYGQVLRAMDVDLIDVVIVGSERHTSLAQTGLYNRNEISASRSVFAERYMRESTGDAAEEGVRPSKEIDASD